MTATAALSRSWSPSARRGLAGLDDKILGLYAGGMTVRDISAHLSELYGTEIGRDTISRITDAVLADVQAWRTRPLDAVYPIVYFDAMRVKVREDRSVRNLACYLALGVTCDGEREVLGHLVARDRGREVLAGGPQRPAPPRRRRRPDRLRRRPQGLPRSDRGDVPAGVGADLHRASHPRVAALRQLPRPQEGRLRAAADLHRRQRRRGPDRARALRGASGAPATPRSSEAWRDAWQHVTPFLSLPEELRRAVYTTNTIEGLHRQIRKAIKTRGHFPDEQAATKLIYFAIMQGRRQVATQAAPGRTTRRPEDPLRRPLPRLTPTTINKSPRPHTQFVGQSRARAICSYPSVRSRLALAETFVPSIAITPTVARPASAHSARTSPNSPARACS